jgi:serine/threonine protein kinase/Tfp pilus assembly protein PilF
MEANDLGQGLGGSTLGTREEREPDFASHRSLKRQLLDELRSGWEAGRPVPPEDLLGRWPGTPDHDTDVASLLFEDYCQRRNRGDKVAPEEYERRFPAHEESLASLRRQQAVFRSVAGASAPPGRLLALPGPGDQVFGFQLQRELGRGSFARVFVAAQTGLAGRPVVVKVSAIDGDEPQTLAQLQHTHIVPIYSVHEEPAAGLRIVCMPYFGGTSLSRILQALWAAHDLPTRGAQLVNGLTVAADTPSITERGGPSSQHTENGPRAALERLSYVRASAWIVARLAEALEHAHERGVLHRDVKPSNILLCADGQPMLLDFNLAQELQGDHARVAATLGGTVAYMAPEHLRALAARDPALVRLVDQRADVYGLGMVLYEMLTGHRPFDQSASYSPMPALIEAMAVERGRTTPSLRQRRGDVPWGLESIVQKCLAPDPTVRYQRAEQLAEDLRRFLDDRPLRYAPELSWRERFGKWVRRHPRLATTGWVAAAASLVLAALLTVLVATRERLHAATDQADAAAARERREEFQRGAERARCLVNGTTDLLEYTGEAIAVCEQALGCYAVLDRDDWQEQPAFRWLPSEQRRGVTEEVRELLVLLARSRVYAAAHSADAVLPLAIAAGLAMLASPATPPGVLTSWLAAEPVCQPALGGLAEQMPQTLRDALALLDRAEVTGGRESKRALWEDRAEYQLRLGETEAAQQALDEARKSPPSGARDYYLLAQALASRQQHAQALTLLAEARRLNPRHYWTWFQRGVCHDEMGARDESLCDFSTAITLWPEFAWSYLMRGRVFQQLGKAGQALEDYSAAVERDPTFALAYLNRASVYMAMQQPQAALRDYDAACALGRNDARLHTGRGMALEALGRPIEADAAFAAARPKDAFDPDLLLAYGFAVNRRLPEAAEAAFTTVRTRQPANPRAHYGCAMLLAHRSRGSADALREFTEALRYDPGFVAARAGRANVLAHQGAWDAARQEIDWCVKTEPTGVMLYQAAGIYALMAERLPGQSQAGSMALDLLAEAFARGYGADQAADDPDLRGIRRDPRFAALLREATRTKEPV